MSDYATTSTPNRPRHTAVSRLSVIQRRIRANGRQGVWRDPPGSSVPQAGFAWKMFADGKTILRGGGGIFRDQLPVLLFGVDRFLPPFFGIESFVFPSFLNPQNALLTQPIYGFSTTYHPKFPYALQYNLNLEQEIAPGTILSAGFVGARGNHLPREADANPFQPALGHRYNPNLPSPLTTVLTDAQSFYDSFQLSVSKQYAHNLSWQLFYTWSHSIDDASTNFSPSKLSMNHQPRRILSIAREAGAGQDSTSGTISSPTLSMSCLLDAEEASSAGNSPLLPAFAATSLPVLSFDNAGLQSLLTSERPNLVGNPYTVLVQTAAASVLRPAGSGECLCIAPSRPVWQR